jgi:ATP-binding cassette subfamily C protein CydD
LGAARSILEILSARPATTFNGQRQIDTAIPPRIKFLQVGFSYSKHKDPVLENVDIGIAAGEHVALVGQSGSGKTTILNLLLGFIQAGQGGIHVNGVPFSELDLEAWRRSLAWLGQDPLLFQGSISANISLGNAQASPADIEAAADRARVLAFAQKLPHGLDTQIGERGWGLSRGQAQRVALARIFLKNAPVLLLDEPTAGLDMDTAQQVMQALISFADNRTVLMLTHRWEQLHHFEKIYHLENGSAFESIQPSPHS